MDRFPASCRFCPTDEQLVSMYLMNKINNQPIPLDVIEEVNIYNYHPRQLTEKFKSYGVKEWYFFTPREKKYPNGSRPNRIANNGYWKATGRDKLIKINNVVVAKRKSLVFYNGKAPKCVKSEWLMHEYVLEKEPTGGGVQKLNYALCQIYSKVSKNEDGKDKNQRHSSDYFSKADEEDRNYNINLQSSQQNLCAYEDFQYQNHTIDLRNINQFLDGIEYEVPPNMNFQDDHQMGATESYFSNEREVTSMIEELQVQPQQDQNQLQLPPQQQDNIPQEVRCRNELTFPYSFNEHEYDVNSNMNFRAEHERDAIGTGFLSDIDMIDMANLLFSFDQDQSHQTLLISGSCH